MKYFGLLLGYKPLDLEIYLIEIIQLFLPMLQMEQDLVFRIYIKLKVNIDLDLNFQKNALFEYIKGNALSRIQRPFLIFFIYFII